MRVSFRYKVKTFSKKQRDFIESQSKDLGCIMPIDQVKWNIEFHKGEFKVSAKVSAPKINLFARGKGSCVEEAVSKALDAIEIQMSKFSRLNKNWRKTDFQKTA